MKLKGDLVGMFAELSCRVAFVSKLKNIFFDGLRRLSRWCRRSGVAGQEAVSIPHCEGTRRSQGVVGRSEMIYFRS